MTITEEVYNSINLKMGSLKIAEESHELAKLTANFMILRAKHLNELPVIYAFANFCYKDSSEGAVLRCSRFNCEEFIHEAIEMHVHILCERRDCEAVAITFFGVTVPTSVEEDSSQILITFVLTGDKHCVTAITQCPLLEEFPFNPDSITNEQIPDNAGFGMINACLKSNKKHNSTRVDKSTAKTSTTQKEYVVQPKKKQNNNIFKIEYVAKLKGYRIIEYNGGEKEQLVIPEKFDDGIHGLLNIKSIGECSFGDAKIKFVVIPKGVIEICDFAFGGSSLTTVHIPNSVKRIGIEAFADCLSLRKVTIGKGLKQIENAFDWCDKLKNIYFAGTTEEWDDLYFSMETECGCTIHCSDGNIRIDSQ